MCGYIHRTTHLGARVFSLIPITDFKEINIDQGKQNKMAKWYQMSLPPGPILKGVLLPSPAHPRNLWKSELYVIFK